MPIYEYKCLRCGKKEEIETTKDPSQLQCKCSNCFESMVRDYSSVKFNTGNLPSKRRNKYLD